MSKRLNKTEANVVATYFCALDDLKKRFCVQEVSFKDATDNAFYDDEWIQVLLDSVGRESPLALKPLAMLMRIFAKVPNDTAKIWCLLDDFVYALSVEIEFLNRYKDISQQDGEHEAAQLAEQAYLVVKEVRIGFLKKIYGDRYDNSRAEKFSAEYYRDCPPLYEAVKWRSLTKDFLRRGETPDLVQLRAIIKLYSEIQD